MSARSSNPYWCEIGCTCGVGKEVACAYKVDYSDQSIKSWYSLCEVLSKLSIGDFWLSGRDEMLGFLVQDSLDADMLRVFRKGYVEGEDRMSDELIERVLGKR